MGEAQSQPFQLSFNPALKVEFQGSRVTSDGGLILVRELDERLGFSALIAHHLTDPRGKNTQFSLADLVRQSVYSRLAGYEDVNDAERLSHDPTFRLIGSEQIWERGAALTSRVHSFETELLTQDKNLAGLAAINRELIARVEAMASPQRVVLDLDSTEIPVYGQQEQSAYNGHFESTCYHPLLLFNREGDCLAAKLRPGNVHSAEDWDQVLLPEIERQQKQDKDVVVRADAAFAKPELYDALEKRGVRYAIRIPSNDILEREVAELLRRSVGRPSHTPVVRYKSFRYQAASWKTTRRVVAKIEFHCGELFPRVGFIVTTLGMDSRAIVRFYNKRGTAEQWIREGKQAVKMTRLSCHRFRANEVRLWLSVIAYTLGNLWRRLVLPKRVDAWSLTSLQQRLMKTGGRLVKHARYYWLLLAEGHLTGRLFGRSCSGLRCCRGPRDSRPRSLRPMWAVRRPRGTCLRNRWPARPYPGLGVSDGLEQPFMGPSVTLVPEEPDGLLQQKVFEAQIMEIPVEMYRTLREEAPPELTCVAILRNAPPAPWLPKNVHGEPIIALVVCHSGGVEQAERLVAAIKTFGAPVGDIVQRRPYVTQQNLLDATQPKGRRYYWKSEYLDGLSPDLLAKVVEHAGRVRSPHFAIILFPVDGAVQRLPEDHSTVGNRNARVRTCCQGIVAKQNGIPRTSSA